MTDLARESPGPTSSRPATKKRTTSRRGSGTIATPASTTAMSPRLDRSLGNKDSLDGKVEASSLHGATARRAVRPKRGDSSQRC